jgi:RNA polymerase sigma factor (sigma-70 family)
MDGAKLLIAHRSIRERLITSNVRLVAVIAKPFARGGFMRYSDLFQEGVIGLMQAVDRYDPYMGYEFSTMATWWIRQAITRAVADKERAIRLPVHVVDRVNRLRHQQHNLSVRYGRPPTDSELAEGMPGETLETTRELLGWDRPVLPLPAGVRSHDYDLELASEIERSEWRLIIQRAMVDIPVRNRRVLRLRFGLAGASQSTLQEIADTLGVTREWVRQMEDRSLRGLRRWFEKHGIRCKKGMAPPKADAEPSV